MRKYITANYTNWISKAYALCRQLTGKRHYFASKDATRDGDSEHSDSSPNTTPPPIIKSGDVFTFENFENYQQTTELYESILNLR